MKILFFANTDWYLYNFRLEFFKFLQKQNIEVVLLSPPGDYGGCFEDLGFRWLQLPLNRAGLNPTSEIPLIARIAKIYRAEKPDLVHHMTIKCVVYGSIAAQLSGIPNRVNAIAGLGTVYSNLGLKARLLKPIVQQLLKIALRGRFSHLILQNPDDLDFFVKNKLIDTKRLHLIRGSGVDGQRFTLKSYSNRTSTQHPCKFLFAARLLWDKGIDYFIQAARQLKEYPQAQFYIAGSPDRGNPDAIDQGYLDACQEEGRVTILGHVKNMNRLMKSMDVIVLPSIYAEGVPRTLVEGAASGLPLVAFDMPGSREIILNGINGFLLPPKDLPGLVDSLRRFILEPELRKEMGEKSRNHFEKEYAQEIVFRKTQAVYKTCLKIPKTF